MRILTIVAAAAALTLTACGSSPETSDVQEADNAFAEEVAAEVAKAPGGGLDQPVGIAPAPEPTAAAPATPPAYEAINTAKENIPEARKDQVTALLRCREERRFAPTPVDQQAAALAAADAEVARDPQAVAKCLGGPSQAGRAIGDAVGAVGGFTGSTTPTNR